MVHVIDRAKARILGIAEAHSNFRIDPDYAYPLVTNLAPGIELHPDADPRDAECLAELRADRWRDRPLDTPYSWEEVSGLLGDVFTALNLNGMRDEEEWA